MSQNKITPEAHTLQDQLIAHVEELLLAQRQEKEHDQSGINTAFAADTSWSGQHARLANPDIRNRTSNPKGFEPYESHTD